MRFFYCFLFFGLTNLVHAQDYPIPYLCGDQFGLVDTNTNVVDCQYRNLLHLQNAPFYFAQMPDKNWRLLLPNGQLVANAISDSLFQNSFIPSKWSISRYDIHITHIRNPIWKDKTTYRIKFQNKYQYFYLPESNIFWGPYWIDPIHSWMDEALDFGDGYSYKKGMLLLEKLSGETVYLNHLGIESPNASLTKTYWGLSNYFYYTLDDEQQFELFNTRNQSIVNRKYRSAIPVPV